MKNRISSFLYDLLNPTYITIFVLFSLVFVTSSFFALPDVENNFCLRVSEVINARNDSDKYSRVYLQCVSKYTDAEKTVDIETVSNRRLYQQALFFNVINSELTINETTSEFNIISYTHKNDREYYCLEDLKFYQELAPKRNVEHGIIVSNNFATNYFPDNDVKDVIGKPIGLGENTYNVCGIYTYMHSYRCTNYSFNSNFGDAVFLNVEDFLNIRSDFATYFTLSGDYEINKTILSVSKQISRSFSAPDLNLNDDFYENQSVSIFYNSVSNFLNSWYLKLIGYIFCLVGLISVCFSLFIFDKKGNLKLRGIYHCKNSIIYFARFFVTCVFQFLMYLIIRLITSSIVIEGFHFVFLGLIANWFFVFTILFSFITTFIFVMKNDRKQIVQRLMVDYFSINI